jgi:2-oxo-4-hydroxy-4-carboxy-5-ureidoimidazoline decarboxylase
MAPPALTLAAVNDLSEPDFTAAFGDIAEHSPWVAGRAAAARPFASREAAVEAFQRAILAAGEAEQTALLAAHPDLAGRAARAGALTADSTREQAGAGLDTLTDEEFTRFTALNDAYRARFGLPFILAVKGATKHTILAAFENRVGGTVLEERLTALAQVLRIVRFRLEDRIGG